MAVTGTVEAGVGEERPTDGRALLAMVDEITRNIPLEVWDDLPVDLAENFEEYMYGELAEKQ